MKTTPDTPEPNFMVDIDNIAETRTGETNGPLSQVDTPDVPVRFSEKKRLHWAGKTCEFNQLWKVHLNTCLANRPRPVDHGRKSCKFFYLHLRKCLGDLTLYYLQPFRRLCVDLGADITCSESMSFLQLLFNDRYGISSIKWVWLLLSLQARKKNGLWCVGIHLSRCSESK